MRLSKEKISAYLKNFYILAGLLFLILMLFIDSNNIFNQYRMNQKVEALKEKEYYYLDKIKSVEQDKKTLTSLKVLEKLAREKYFMKKRTEDLYVIVEE
ncbi:MAG TPA: septum formation initiator family protein [Cyclobacteriaceae bacterium]